jgi:hypothetical protein
MLFLLVVWLIMLLVGYGLRVHYQHKGKACRPKRRRHKLTWPFNIDVKSTRINTFGERRCFCHSQDPPATAPTFPSSL